MSFLPPSYEVPQTGQYMKFVIGKNRFRVLSPAIVGNEFWRAKGDGREPVRRRMGETIAAVELEWNPKENALEKVRHFWAFAIWSYAAKAVQILEITQKSVMTPIQDLVEEEDWGDPTGYDIIVTRSGSGLDTEYAVQPAPAKPIDPAILEAYRVAHPNMEALYAGGDPFAKKGAVNSPAVVTSPPSDSGAPTTSRAAMTKAMGTYRQLYPSTPKDELRQAWDRAVNKYFSGRKVELIAARSWAEFELDGFEKPKIQNPISEEPVFADDEIPF